MINFRWVHLCGTVKSILLLTVAEFVHPPLHYFFLYDLYYTLLLCIIINPRRACAARVTVVVLCVCRPSVCLPTTILGLQATRRLMSDTDIFSAIRARKLN